MIESNTMVGTGTGMKVVCSRDELTQKLSIVARAVSTRASVQILSGVLLRAESGRLHLAATDMELSLRSSVEAQVEGEGSVVVPGRLLVDLVRLLPADEVTFEHRAEEGVVHVVSGPSSSSLHTYSAEDFPRLPDLDTVGTFTIDRETLLETIARVARSASRDESRPVLTGLLDAVRRVAVMAQRNSPLRMRFAEGELTLLAQTQDVGEARESLPVGFAGDPLEIGFNADFLREGIESVSSDEVQLKLISPLRPGLISD